MREGLEKNVESCIEKKACYREEGLCSLSDNRFEVPCAHLNKEVVGMMELYTSREGTKKYECYGCKFRE